MSSDERQNGVAVLVHDVGKVYHIYDKPQDRLKQSLWRGYRTFYREFWALRHVNFEMRAGEALGIIGRNGSGKSTLLQIIAGTLMPSEGTVEVNGRVAALLELGSGFNPDFTGRENVYMNGAILGLSKKEMDERFDDIAAFADIGEFLEQPIKTYSSGMLVRLAFAVQVQVQPNILIVDEALAVGDMLFQKRCFQRMEQLRNEGVTLLFVSHDQESIRTLTSKALLLTHGRTTSHGSSAEVVLEYRRQLHEDEKAYFAAEIQRSTAKADSVAAHQTNQTAEIPSADQSVDSAERSSEVSKRSKAGTATSARLSFGDYDAEILDVKVFNADREESSIFYPGDRLILCVRVVTHKDLTHLNIAVRIRSKEGVKVYSWGTLNQDIAIWSGRETGEVFWDRSFKAGQTISVDFECECPIGANLYEVQAAVSEENDRFYNAQRMLHWRDEAAFFQVFIANHEYFFGGICDMRMSARVRN